MLFESIITSVGIILAISVASKRTVTIIKSILPEISDRFKTPVYSLMSIASSSVIYLINGYSLPLFNNNILNSNIVSSLFSRSSLLRRFWSMVRFT